MIFEAHSRKFLRWTNAALAGGVVLFALAATAFADFTVVIDPGHGGKPIRGKSDSTQEGDGASWNNAKNASGTYLEKDLTLSYSLAIKQAFESSEKARAMKIRVVLTRADDTHLSAMERAAVAVRESADVLLSVHFNAANGKAEGTRVYFGAAEHPAWEFMHFTNAYAERDKRFCQMIADEVANALQLFGGKPEKRVVVEDVSDRKDGLRILGYTRQDTHMRNAALGLLEVEFIDNPAVDGWLLSASNKPKTEQAVGEGVVRAICAWLEQPAAARDYVEKARKAPGRH
jgi:N-acetylmuramoyl-L-alanine amidase